MKKLNHKLYQSKPKPVNEPPRPDTLVPDTDIVDVNQRDTAAVQQFYAGTRELMDYIAPPAFHRGNETYLQVGLNYVRSFSMSGFPREVSVGWLRDLYQYEGDMDTALYIEPIAERVALDELTAKIAQAQADLIMEEQKGSVARLTELRTVIERLYQERSMLEQQYQRQFQVSLFSNLYVEDLKELKQRTEKLDNRFKGRHIYHMPNVLQQDEGYKSCLPFGKNYLPKTCRNFNSGALTGCFPFYNAELIHSEGVYLGQNLSTGSPVFVDAFNRQFVNNSNIMILGESGSGKTVTTTAFVYRNILRGARAIIIDPEGEFSNFTNNIGGAVIKMSSTSMNQHQINPFEIEYEDEIDQYNRPTGRKVVDLKGKANDILNLIGVMIGELDAEMRSVVSFTVQDLYKSFGITADPASLYMQDAQFDEENEDFYFADVKKTMPTFSDFHHLLEQYAARTQNQRLKTLVNSLLIFKKGGLFDLFDGQTSEELRHYKEAPVISFDVLDLDDSGLRPLAMFVALSFAWEHFGKKTPGEKKFIVVDEGWLMTSKNMKGHEYTAGMLEKIARRFRKRTGGLIVSTQQFHEFSSSAEGLAILNNSAMNMFLKTKSEELDALQSRFKLSNGEINFLFKAKRGQVLIRTAHESAVVATMILPSEHAMIIDKLPIHLDEE